MSALDMAVGPQAEAIALPSTVRAFVEAGPGAGKTWTLLRRAETLARRDEVRADRMLVLSFTRAVVVELRRRQAGAGGVGRIVPETFDSFAGRLLARHADGAVHGSYDSRIQQATALLRSRAAHETMGPLRHILLDEVQDLVGPRARFVEALLEYHEGGFTAFGDPAQAIYDHEQDVDSGRFLDELDRLADRRITLVGNHRAEVDLARQIDEVRGRLMNAGPSDRPADDLYLACDTLGVLESMPDLVGGYPGRTGILCRDNATALQLSRLLHQAGVYHRVQRRAADRPVGGWVAAVVGDSQRVDRAQLAERLDALTESHLPCPDVDAAWGQLQRLDREARGQAVRAVEINRAIGRGRIPADMTDDPEEHIVVSTIHRAKGLEFDQCVIVDWARDSVDDLAELEQRVLFVALSRARRMVLHVAGSERRNCWYRDASVGGRLIKRGKARWQTFGLEVYADDVHAADPAGAVGFDDAPPEVQHRLVHEVQPGDEVVLERVADQDLGTGEVPTYAVIHPSGPLGITGRTLGDSLLRRSRTRAPARIVGLRVDGVETLAGSPDAGRAAGLGSSGLWLRPRLGGLGEFEWEQA